MKRHYFVPAQSVLALLIVFPVLCSSVLGDTNQVFLSKRDFIINDPSLKVKPMFVSLPAGAVTPQGWIKDTAVSASKGITGHLDEWSPTYGMAWKGVGFEARGADPVTGMGWPLEQSSYWLDGAVRLAYILNDKALKDKITARLDMVVDGVLNGGESFIYWQKVDFIAPQSQFNSWAHSHMGRALVAYYEASGNPKVLEALKKVYGHFSIVPLPIHTSGLVSGCTNADPMLATYELSGDKRILNTLLNMAAAKETEETVQKWDNGTYERGHGVIVYENLRIPALLYLLNNNPDFLKAAKTHLDCLDKDHTQPCGIASSEEHVAGRGAVRLTETCNVACSAYTYQQLYAITGEGELGDRIEKIFFNAAPAPVARDYGTMSYYQSPNRIEGLMPGDFPGHPGGYQSIQFSPLGHEVLCCVGNLTRSLPNYIMNMWQGTIDKGIAATLYGPCIVQAVVGKDVPVKITSETEYPFKENILLTIDPEQTTQFPLYLRVPGWCRQPEIKVNGEAVDVSHSVNGFVKVDRQWKSGDKAALNFPMSVKVVDDYETPYPQTSYFQKGGSAGRAAPAETDIHNPFRSVYYGPLLFALPVKDINPNQQVPGEKWNYALVSNDASTIQVSHSAMPAVWSWQIDEAPVKLTVKASTFDWKPTPALPLPKETVQVTESENITLVPYGCTKFRISMFPIATLKH